MNSGSPPPLPPVLSSAAPDGVETWAELVRQQQATIQAQQKTIQAQQETIEALERQLRQQQERIEQLEADLRAQKKLKGKPKIGASRLNEPASAPEGKSEKKRPGSAKRSKKLGFEIHEERIIPPTDIPATAKFNGYRDYDVQELTLERHNIRFRLAEYVREDGTTLVGQLPAEYRHGHYGPLLVGYILYQHYQCRVPHPLIHEQLQEWGIDISTGQLHNLLSENQESFHAEQQQVLRVGLETASYVHTDDTGARHQGKNGYCTVIGNAYFTYFRTTERKSRQSFLETLQGEVPCYVLNEYAQQYLQSYPLAAKHWQRLSFSSQVLARDPSQWQAHLTTLGIVTSQATRLVTEAALLGGLIEHGVDSRLILLSDGAPQFKVLVHALCWVHAERALRRLHGNTRQQRHNIEEMQQLLWQYYQQLKAYQQAPTAAAKECLEQAFDQLFGRCFLHHASLNTVLSQFRAHKAELLRMLDFPQLPLHNNDGESDIREYVTRRKVSGGTRSEAGRRARDTFVGLKKTCRKLGLSFWQFLMSRLRGDGQIPPLPDVIRAMASGLRQIASPA
jgi:multidrug efflux pump subunit AcrA (membrane-fusion protein)